MGRHQAGFYNDTTPPTLSTPEVYDLGATGYWVRLRATDNVGVTSVSYPSWTEPNGQDDLLWKDEVSWDDDTVYFFVSAGDHGGQTNCYYNTHIYVRDAAGNQSFVGVPPCSSTPSHPSSPTFA